MNVNVFIMCFCTLSYCLFYCTFYILCGFIERWKWLWYLAYFRQRNSEKQPDVGILGLNKFSGEWIGLAQTTVITCAVVSRTGSENISEIILTSSQVSSPTGTIFLGNFLLGNKSGLAQLLSKAILKAMSVACHSYCVNNALPYKKLHYNVLFLLFRLKQTYWNQIIAI